jgi:hypothetical protein
MRSFDPGDFEVLYPGLLTEKERAPLAKYLADNRALEERRPLDVTELVSGRLPAGTPGVLAVVPVAEDMVRYNNAKYDPDNPLLHDAAYANQLGYPDILAMPCFGAHDDSFMAPCPADMRDTLLVSQLNHSVTSYRAVHPGDTLFMVAHRRTVTDLTPPEGSTHRHLVLRTEGSVYNQRAEKVNDTVWRVMESMRVFKDGRKPVDFGPADVWESAEWVSRPAHYYADKDWEVIVAVWANERRQGAVPLYWEDVKIGDQPVWTADGPLDDTAMPTAPFGQGTGGSRTLRHEIMDPATRRSLVRSEADGIYRPLRREDYVPPVPENPGTAVPVPVFEGDATASGAAGGDIARAADSTAPEGAIDTRDIHRAVAGARAPLINFYGRDIAVRHIDNWMGDHGWLCSIRWGLMPAQTMADYGKPVPANPDVVRFLDPVPHLRGRYAEAHGLTRDLALVKSYVYDKYVRDGQFLVELAWWIEAVTGEIWLEGGTTVRLPSKRVG